MTSTLFWPVSHPIHPFMHYDHFIRPFFPFSFFFFSLFLPLLFSLHFFHDPKGSHIVVYTPSFQIGDGISGYLTYLLKATFTISSLCLIPCIYLCMYILSPVFIRMAIWLRFLFYLYFPPSFPFPLSLFLLITFFGILF